LGKDYNITKIKATISEVFEKTSCFRAVQKCSDARRAKNRTARRICIYVERFALQRNTVDERFSTATQPPVFPVAKKDTIR
jgi:hypothetical protein